MRPYPLTSEELVDDVLAGEASLAVEVRERFRPLSDAQLAWRPAADRWGVADCLVHLTRTNELYRGALHAAVDAGDAISGTPGARLRGRWFGRWFTGAVGPRVRVKVKAPAAIRPGSAPAAEGAVERFLAEQERFQELAWELRGLDLDRLSVRSPVAGWIRFSAGDALRIVVEHDKRHVKQAVTAMESPSFPGRPRGAEG